MAVRKLKLGETLGLIASLLAVLSAGIAVMKYVTKPKIYSLEHFIGAFEGKAQTADFVMGLQSVGGNELIGEVDFSGLDMIEVELKGKYNRDDGVVELTYVRNEDHPLGPDSGDVRLTYDKKERLYKGYWASTIQPGNSETWTLKKTSNEYVVRSWDG